MKVIINNQFKIYKKKTGRVLKVLINYLLLCFFLFIMHVLLNRGVHYNVFTNIFDLIQILFISIVFMNQVFDFTKDSFLDWRKHFNLRRNGVAGHFVFWSIWSLPVFLILFHLDYPFIAAVNQFSLIADYHPNFYNAFYFTNPAANYSSAALDFYNAIFYTRILYTFPILASVIFLKRYVKNVHHRDYSESLIHLSESLSILITILFVMMLIYFGKIPSIIMLLPFFVLNNILQNRIEGNIIDVQWIKKMLSAPKILITIFIGTIIAILNYENDYIEYLINARILFPVLYIFLFASIYRALNRIHLISFWNKKRRLVIFISFLSVILFLLFEFHPVDPFGLIVFYRILIVGLIFYFIISVQLLRDRPVNTVYLKVVLIFLLTYAINSSNNRLFFSFARKDIIFELFDFISLKIFVFLDFFTQTLIFLIFLLFLFDYVFVPARKLIKQTSH